MLLYRADTGPMLLLPSSLMLLWAGMMTLSWPANSKDKVQESDADGDMLLHLLQITRESSILLCVKKRGNGTSCGQNEREEVLGIFRLGCCSSFFFVFVQFFIQRGNSLRCELANKKSSCTQAVLDSSKQLTAKFRFFAMIVILRWMRLLLRFVSSFPFSKNPASRSVAASFPVPISGYTFTLIDSMDSTMSRPSSLGKSLTLVEAAK